MQKQEVQVPKLVWTGREKCAFSNSLIMPTVELVPLHAKRHSRPVTQINPNGHHVIVGDNLQALEFLHATTDIKFNFIYIDPPYNSGSKLSYNDSRSRKGDADPVSTWLNFMYPRLQLARMVMEESGYIFVSIDDRQYAELTLIMHEIFGRENHIGTLKWRKKRKASFLDQHLSTTMEYILVYARDCRKAKKLLGEKANEATRPVLNASNQISERVLKKGTPAFCADGVYKKGVLKNRTLEFELLSDMVIKGGKLAAETKVRGRFRVSQEVLNKSVFVTKNFGLRRHVDESERTRKHATDDATEWPTNEDAETELRDIFQTKVFTYPKPVGLIRNLLSMCEVPQGRSFYCLDFFAGSGTLSEAVLEANKDDGAQRRFFCIQSPEPLPEAQGVDGLKTIADLTCLRAAKAHEKCNDPAKLFMYEMREIR